MGGTATTIILLVLTLTAAYAEAANGCQRSQICRGYTKGATIKENPENCGSYCICTCDGAILMPCPRGMEFNSYTKQCDYKENARCKKPEPPTPNPCDKVKPLCPPTNEGNATILPNPDDCESYCVCDWGNAIWMQCPEGLQFNPVLHVCDWPDHAGCKPGPHTTSTSVPTPAPTTTSTSAPTPTSTTTTTPTSTTTTTPTSTTTTTTDSTPTPTPASTPAPSPASTPDPTPAPTPEPSTKGPEPPTSNPCEKVKPLCPPTNEDNATILPNPDDCSSYCVCNWGNASWMPCPAGLQFNPVLHVCDWPDHAGCQPAPGPTPNPGSTPNPGPTPTKRPEPPTPNPCEKVKDLCPPTNQENATILPNPGDCGSYCMCDWGNAIWIPCPDDLHFNAALHVCDWPDHAGCTTGPDSTTEPNPESTPIPTTSPTPKPSTNGPEPPNPNPCDKVKPLCPSTNEGNATILPNDDDCGSYCVCDWGHAIWMPCPAGLLFNPVLHVCDWPEHAGCSGPTPNPGSTPNPGPPPTKVPEPPTPNPCEKVKPLCPPTNEGNATILPNPDDCGSYCMCDWGNAIWMPCPDDLHFNADLHVCDWPDRAGCS